jgi:hypothetical protein
MIFGSKPWCLSHRSTFSTPKNGRMVTSYV